VDSGVLIDQSVERRRVRDDLVSLIIRIEGQQPVYTAPHDHLVGGRHAGVTFLPETLAKNLKVGGRGEKFHCSLRSGGPDSGEDSRLLLPVAARHAENYREESVSESCLAELISFRPVNVLCAIFGPSVRYYLFPGLCVEVDGERAAVKDTGGVRAVVRRAD